MAKTPLVEPSVVKYARFAPAIMATSDCAAAIAPEGLPKSSVNESSVTSPRQAGQNAASAPPPLCPGV